MAAFTKCGKPDCFRKVSPASAYCCGSCTAAAERGFEIEPHDPAVHPFLCHSADCEQRKAERGEFTFAEVQALGL